MYCRNNGLVALDLCDKPRPFELCNTLTIGLRAVIHTKNSQLFSTRSSVLLRRGTTIYYGVMKEAGDAHINELLHIWSG